MKIVRHHSQPDYRLCNMTVTVYHREGLTRQVFDRAFYEYARETPASPGTGEQGAFLLVVPMEEQKIFPGDKVVLGRGPEAVSWEMLNRGNFPTLSTVKEVKCRFFAGKMCHCEGR